MHRNDLRILRRLSTPLGGYRRGASEEKCFALLKRKVILYCPQCREDTGNIDTLMQKNRKLKQEINILKENKTSHQKICDENSAMIKTAEDMKTYIISLEEKIKNLQKDSKTNEQQNIEYNVKLKQKDSENNNLLAKIDQLKDTLEKTQLKYRNTQDECDKLKEKNDNLEVMNAEKQKKCVEWKK
ncbi:hypothetical protein WA026_004172 [Henosepilachna vigintioctopunctata]|uniref:Uncharacterized protein n=1 Tax=Henosepilachna vigintioctopunctata TaxID=420089 RepID=A0AAW1U8Q9_9CUCU